MIRRKTYNDWELNSYHLDLDVYLQIGDEIDEEIVEHIGYAIVQPNYQDKTIMQCGEPSYEENNGYYYMTARKDGDKWFWLGDQPDAKILKHRKEIKAIKLYPLVQDPLTGNIYNPNLKQ
jgi:hypothetical protein